MIKLHDILLDDLTGLKRKFKRKFNRLLGLGILFIIFGHLFIIEPYFSYKNEQTLLSSQVAERKERLQIAENQFSEIECVV